MWQRNFSFRNLEDQNHEAINVELPIYFEFPTLQSGVNLQFWIREKKSFSSDISIICSKMISCQSFEKLAIIINAKQPKGLLRYICQRAPKCFLCISPSWYKGISVQGPEKTWDMLAEPPPVHGEEPERTGDVVDLNFQVNIGLIVKTGRMRRPGARTDSRRNCGTIMCEFWKGREWPDHWGTIWSALKTSLKMCPVRNGSYSKSGKSDMRLWLSVCVLTRRNHQSRGFWKILICKVTNMLWCF